MPSKPKENVLALPDPATAPGELKPIGGSRSDDWNNALANQTVNALRLKSFTPEEQEKRMKEALANRLSRTHATLA